MALGVAWNVAVATALWAVFSKRVPRDRPQAGSYNFSSKRFAFFGASKARQKYHAAAER